MRLMRVLVILLILTSFLLSACKPSGLTPVSENNDGKATSPDKLVGVSTTPVLLPTGGNQTIAVPAKISVPSGKPVIFERLAYVMSGNFTYLYIYPDGNVIYFIEKNLRGPTHPDFPPTRIWKTGHVDAAGLNQLLALFQSDQFATLNNSYTFPGTPISGGGIATSGEILVITVDSATVNKTVSTYEFPVSNLPPPLPDIYIMLQTVSANTTEVLQEKISK